MEFNDSSSVSASQLSARKVVTKVVTKDILVATSTNQCLLMPTLTKKEIDAAKPVDGKDRYIADGGGLFLKVAANGSKSFVFRYSYGKHRRLMTLGKYGKGGLTLAEAREKHADARKTLASEVDPLQMAQAARQELKTALTVEQLGEEWLSRVIDKQFKRPEDVRRLVKVNIYPRIGKFLAKDITSREVAMVINKITDRGAPVQANRVLRIVKKLFAYAVEQSHIASNPVIMTIKGAGGTESSRERNLSFEEIAAVLKDIKSGGGNTSWQVRSILEVLFLTGQRSGEVCGMEWKHIDFDAYLWKIPAMNTKSERAHTVHLSKEVVAVLKQIQLKTGLHQYVFTSEEDDKRHIETRSLSQALRKRLKREDMETIQPFTPHDLRRTVASRMSDMSIAPHVIEKILNHMMTGVMGVYNRGEYLPERKAALELWGQRIAQLASGDISNVVFLKVAAA